MTKPAAGSQSELDAFWSAIVAAHADLPELLRIIAVQVVEIMGDGCVLTMLSADGARLEPQAIAHSDAAVEAAMRAVLATDDMRVGEGVAGSVAADRRPVVLNDLPPQTVAATTPARFLPFVRDHPVRAMMIVPLLASGELLGTLGSVRTSSGAPYTLVDLRRLEALAERAALAVYESLLTDRGVGPADFEALFRHNLDGVLFTTPDGRVLAANPAACEILGRSERDIVAGGREALVLPDDPRLAAALATRAATGRVRTELAMRRGDGTIVPASLTSTIYTTPDHDARAVVIFRDISQEAAARDEALAQVAELRDAADRDPLTGLLNRRGFATAAEQALAMADRDGVVAQLLFIDVDGMKRINDRLGHAAGDAALVAVAGAIRAAVRHPDVACRLGGDEFLLLLLDTEAAEVAGVVSRIDKALVDDQAAPLPIGFSMGVVERAPGLEASVSELVDAADRAMYQQKLVSRLRSRP